MDAGVTPKRGETDAHRRLKRLAVLCAKPVWHDNAAESRLHFLQRIAVVGTRNLNRQLEIDFDLVQSQKRQSA